MPDHQLYEALLEARRTSQSVVLATIVRDQGSVPRHAGAKMVIYPDGRTMGTIGGGELESRVIARCGEILKTGRPDLLHYELAEPSQGDPGICGGQLEIFMEPIMPDPTVLIIGCGHCGQALAELAHWVGFRVIVSDDRPDFCNAEVIRHADEHIIASPSEIAERVPIHSRTYIAAVTRAAPLDVEMLPALLKTPAAYIGVLGSRRRWAMALRQLREQGVDEESLSRIHAPIGLEIHAETPREIAISIMAEILAITRGGSNAAMEWKGSDHLSLSS